MFPGPLLPPRRRRALLWTCALAASTATGLPAQSPGPAFWHNEVFAGSEMEVYLRLLQTRDSSTFQPWSVRGLSPREVRRLLPADSLHPWAARFPAGSDSAGGSRFRLVRPEVRLVGNSAFPYGGDDGAVWAGRGVTAALRAGFSAELGPVSLVVAPVVFGAGNAGFDLYRNEQPGPLAYGDPTNWFRVDLPQRFGDGAYTRVDPGQSTLRLDTHGVAVGVSTANQVWGPASAFPLLLGNNAAGFPHLFLGTSGPARTPVGSFHGRAVWGRLSQSEFSPMPADSATRVMAGFVAAYAPRGIDGLEVGLARFFHDTWGDGPSLGQLTRPLVPFLKENTSDQGGGPDGRSDAANQLASVFGRWVVRPAGLEVYGEYAREDHNWDVRDFILEPDHSSAYMLGLRKTWAPAPSRFLVLRGEVLNAQASHLAQIRPQPVFYTHYRMRQGHTHRGQLLGAPAAYGGAGAMLGVDYYRPDGRWSLEWTRSLREEAQIPVLNATHSLGAEVLLFRGRWDVLGGVTGVWDLNRNFRSDAFNANAVLEVRAGL